MSNQYLSFDVTKQSAPQQLVTGRQGDSQLKFVTMLFWDGDKNVPYDLTGKQVAFEALKQDNTHVVDYEGITILDAPAGLVRYSFNEQVFSVAGTMQQAFFKITHTDSDNNVITDSTLEIAINILENRVEFGINSEDYLSEYDKLIKEVEQKFDDYAKTVLENIADVKKVHDELTDLITQVELINATIKRRVATKDSSTIKMSQSGNWDSDSTTTLSGDVVLSQRNNNSLSVIDDGLFTNADENKVLKSIISGKDISILSSEYVLSPHLARNAVVQSFYFNAKTGKYYVTQSYTKDVDGFVVSKLDVAGNLLSNMYITDGGHGSSVSFFSNDNSEPTIYFQDGGSNREVVYKDNATYNKADCPIAFAPPVNGNGMLSYTNNYMAHINNQTQNVRTLSIYKYTRSDNGFNFGTDSAEVDITSYIPEETNVLQGIAIMDESAINGGIQTDNIYIFVYGGTATIQATLTIFKYSISLNSIMFVGVKKGLENVTQDTDDFEPEALCPVVIDNGVHVASGLLYGISGGVIGKRHQYIYGFLNKQLSDYLTANRDSDSSSKNVKFATETSLYKVLNEGEYELSSADAMNVDDFPYHWRGIDSQAPWVLRVSHNNQNGDIIQTLYRRGVSSPIEMYIRTINYSANDFGAGYLPTGIGYWNVVKMDGQQERTYTSSNVDKFNKLSDFSIPGTRYYVSSNGNSIISDFEGLGDWIGTRAFNISTKSWGASGDRVWQQVEVMKSDVYMYAVRILPVKKETYGPSMLLNTTTLPKWTIISGTTL